MFCGRSSAANGSTKEKLPYCKCRRSACVRNYCQCYDQKRMCGPDCRCFNCQNRFSMGRSKDEMAKPSNDQNGSSARSSRKLFENDTYENFAQSLFSTVKSCQQTGSDTQTTQRQLLQTFHAGLNRLNENIDKKLNERK